MGKMRNLNQLKNSTMEGNPMNKPKIGYYVMAGQRIMDGPFADQSECEDHLMLMCGEWASPELLKQFIVHFNGKVLDLVKDNGEVITGHLLRSRRNV